MPIKAVAFDVHGTLGHWRGRRAPSLPMACSSSPRAIWHQISYQAFDAARQATFSWTRSSDRSMAGLISLR
jgi:hypothetical protein